VSSLFNRDSGPKQPLDPYSRERIKKEIGHLTHRESVRHPGKRIKVRTKNKWVTAGVILALALLGLFLLDPPMHAYYRGEAIRAYLYLHHFGSDRKATELIDTGIFRGPELELLNHRSGNFENYYSSPIVASKAADDIIRYLQGVEALRHRDYDQLDTLSKVRYWLFARWGLFMPTHWEWLDPAINY
jgi:hypothetical protein